jgi:lipoprotein NlpI
MKTLRLLAVLMVVFSLSSCKFFKQQKWFSKDVDTLLTAQDATLEPDTVMPEIETIVQETEPVKTGQATYGYGNDQYYMVVGSFLSEQLANKYAQKMVSLGYNPQIVYSSSLGFYRVSAKSYTDYNTAINDIPDFRDDVTPRAWVHIKK